jgi:monovalent cation/hydrogen antiporter
MGIVIGLLIAAIFYVVHRYLPTTPGIDAALTFMSPYFMYITAEHFHFSGVMAVVTGGLFLSSRSNEIFAESKSRIQTISTWATVVFILNGLVFILIGLELPFIIKDLGNSSIGEGIKYGLIISLVIIVIRILYVLPIAYVPKWLGQKVRMDPKNPTWKGPLIIGWAGMRGVVSLASALSVPLLLQDGSPFPHRSLILFITFIVILVTLVFQGLTLPLIIKWVNIKDTEDFPPEEEQDAAINLKLMHIALKELNHKYAAEIKENELVGFLKTKLESDITIVDQRLASMECDATQQEEVDAYNKVLLHLYAVQRQELVRLRKHKAFSDDEIRKHESQLDLDEARITETGRY